MTLVVLSIVAATLLGLAFRGSFARLGQPATRRNGLLAFGALSLCTVFIAKHPSVWAGWVAAGAIALIAYARLNRGRPGLALMAAGMLLNVLVIALNSAMPLSLDAVERAGVPDDRLDTASDPLREPLVDDTRLPWIGETVPLALPVRPDVASPGDLLVAAGAAVFMFTGLTGRGRPRPEPPKKKKGRRARNRKQAAETADQTAGGSSTAPADSDAAATLSGVGALSAGSAMDAEGAGALDPFTGGRLRNVTTELVEQPQMAVAVLAAVPDPVTPPEFGPVHGAGRPAAAGVDTAAASAIPTNAATLADDGMAAAEPPAAQSVANKRNHPGGAAKKRAAAGRHAAPPRRRAASRPARSTDGSLPGSSSTAAPAAPSAQDQATETPSDRNGTAPSGPPAAWDI